MEAVNQSSAMILKNAQAIEASTKVLNQLSINPNAIKIIALLLLVFLILMPLLMVIFMWQIHRHLKIMAQK